MKRPRRDQTGLAFTLVELLVVIAVMAILASLLLPAVLQSKARGLRAKCLSNLHQISLGFNLFAHDHDGRYPMQVPAGEGGSLDYVGTPQAFRHFQALSNQLVTLHILVCPADKRLPAMDWTALRNRHVSYFVGLTARSEWPLSLLAGDRNITNATAPTLPPEYLLNQGASWTGELHRFQGNVVLADGSVHRFDDRQLREALLAAAGSAAPGGNPCRPRRDRGATAA
jgi:prepilin-type N-terminal cleavage/methylation domain-containing protein